MRVGVITASSLQKEETEKAEGSDAFCNALDWIRGVPSIVAHEVRRAAPLIAYGCEGRGSKARVACSIQLSIIFDVVCARFAEAPEARPVVKSVSTAFRHVLNCIEAFIT